MALKQITGLWEKQSKKGTVYWSGKTKGDLFIPDGTFLSLFENTDKKDERSADFSIHMTTEDDNDRKK